MAGQTWPAEGGWPNRCFDVGDSNIVVKWKLFQPCKPRTPDVLRYATADTTGRALSNTRQWLQGPPFEREGLQ